MVELQNKQAALQTEISLLRLQASELGSMGVVETQAQELGFIEYDKPIAVITTSQFTAAR